MFFPWKCGVMSTGLGDPGSSEGSPRCTESLEKASCTSSGSASASAPATANPTVRLIGCAMAIACLIWARTAEARAEGCADRFSPAAKPFGVSGAARRGHPADTIFSE